MIKIDKTTNYEHKSAHRSSSELAPASWLDALEAAHRQLEEVHGSLDKAENCPHCRKITLVVEAFMKEAKTERSRASNAAICREGGQKNEEKAR